MMSAALRADDVPPLTTHTAFTQWEFAPVVTVGVVVAAVIYLRWCGRGSPPSSGRTVADPLDGLVPRRQRRDRDRDAEQYRRLRRRVVLDPHGAARVAAHGRAAAALARAARSRCCCTPLAIRCTRPVKRIVRSAPINVITFPLLGVLLYIAHRRRHPPDRLHEPDAAAPGRPRPRARALPASSATSTSCRSSAGNRSGGACRSPLGCSCSCSRCRSTPSPAWC